MAAARMRSAMWTLGVWAFVVACVLGRADAAIRYSDTGDQLPIGADNREAANASPAPPTLQRHGPRLNFSSSAPHLFASTYGLLQQWSNTVFPNGHAFAAATIPAYTLLFHGLHADKEDADHPERLSPPSPEWLAFDTEMSYGIMGSSRRSWLLTYQTVRPIRVLYVDGESAALMGLGQLDSQMLLLYGNVTGPSHQSKGFGLRPEYDRARGMCAWLDQQGLRGRGWGFEGIVRMNAGFEVIWCDFLSDSLRLLSRLNVTAPLNPVDSPPQTEDADGKGGDLTKQSYFSLPPVPTRSDVAIEPTNPPAPPNWRGGRYGNGPGSPSCEYEECEDGEEPFLTSQGWGWFESAARHYGSSRANPGLGETRVQLDNCGILSYYAPRFEGHAQDGASDELMLARSRALEEQQYLNLTTEGYWDPSSAENRTVALRQLARRRRYHHLGNASVGDALLMRRSAERVLARSLSTSPGDSDGKVRDGVCSGAPWTLILAEIVQRIAQQLKTLEAILLDGYGTQNGSDARAWLYRLRAQNHIFMVGYVEYPDARDNTIAWQPGSDLFNRTLSLCRYRYTRLFAQDQRQHQQTAPLLPEEEDLRWAVEETYGTICHELLTIGFDVERTWAERYSKAARSTADRSGEGPFLPVAQWHDRLTELMAWLGWESEFIGCDRVCGWHERCFIPMWPMMSSQWPHRHRGAWPRPYQNGSYGDYPMRPPDYEHGFPRSRAMMGNDTELWEPKCIEPWYLDTQR
ncbi:hypothetical protein SEPCBS119000_003184 [Sporothrix epigloea]|uniref:Uncharacterized protein n=1 Tax=Sporothrix epigloea TaxID=1892477 RepID=A0ABP0DLJ2_9PEZI